MNSIKKGAENIIKNCLPVKPKEKIVIVTDKESLKITKVVISEAKKVTSNLKLFIMEDFGKRPLNFFPREIKKAVEKADTTIHLAQSFPKPDKKELANFIRPLRLLAIKKGREVHMPNMNKTVMKDGVCSDYKKVNRITNKVYDIVKNAKQIEVITKKGTNLVVNFDKKYKWMKATALIKKGEYSNIPGDEVYTYPSNINGLAIVDGVIGNFFSKKYGLIEKNPVNLKIKNGKLISFSCKYKNIKKDLKNYLDSDRNGRRVGEFALGTNIFLKRLIGRNIQDEKFPTVHIALGHPFPDITNAPYKSKIHVDFVIKDCSVFADGKKIMEKGKYTFI